MGLAAALRTRHNFKSPSRPTRPKAWHKVCARLQAITAWNAVPHGHDLTAPPYGPGTSAALLNTVVGATVNETPLVWSCASFLMEETAAAVA